MFAIFKDTILLDSERQFESVTRQNTLHIVNTLSFDKSLPSETAQLCCNAMVLIMNDFNIRHTEIPLSLCIQQLKRNKSDAHLRIRAVIQKEWEWLFTEMELFFRSRMINPDFVRIFAKINQLLWKDLFDPKTNYLWTSEFRAHLTKAQTNLFFLGYSSRGILQPVERKLDITEPLAAVKNTLDTIEENTRTALKAFLASELIPLHVKSVTSKIESITEQKHVVEDLRVVVRESMPQMESWLELVSLVNSQLKVTAQPVLQILPDVEKLGAGTRLPLTQSSARLVQTNSGFLLGDTIIIDVSLIQTFRGLVQDIAQNAAEIRQYYVFGKILEEWLLLFDYFRLFQCLSHEEQDTILKLTIESDGKKVSASEKVAELYKKRDELQNTLKKNMEELLLYFGTDANWKDKGLLRKTILAKMCYAQEAAIQHLEPPFCQLAEGLQQLIQKMRTIRARIDWEPKYVTIEPDSSKLINQIDEWMKKSHITENFVTDYDMPTTTKALQRLNETFKHLNKDSRVHTEVEKLIAEKIDSKTFDKIFSSIMKVAVYICWLSILYEYSQTPS